MWVDRGYTGFPPEFYAARDTFSMDAAACFNAHRRPQAECIDWHADSKRLTDEKWQQREEDSRKKLKSLGLESSFKPPREHVYLCAWCPVSSYVMQKQREQRGMYDN